MIPETVISLQNVSKCFKRYQHPVDRLKEILLPGKSCADEFWAVQNINIEIEKGHTLGIVGRNGSGKTTAIRLLLNLYTPNRGEVFIKNKKISSNALELYKNIILMYNMFYKITQLLFCFTFWKWPQILENWSEDHFGTPNGPWTMFSIVFFLPFQKVRKKHILGPFF